MDGNLYGSIFLFYFNSLCTTGGLICFVNLILSKSIMFKDVGRKTIFFLGYQYIIIVILKHYYPVLGSSNAYMFINTLITFTLLCIISIPVYKFFPYLVGKFKFLSKI